MSIFLPSLIACSSSVSYTPSGFSFLIILSRFFGFTRMPSTAAVGQLPGPLFASPPLPSSVGIILHGTGLSLLLLHRLLRSTIYCVFFCETYDRLLPLRDLNTQTLIPVIITIISVGCDSRSLFSSYLYYYASTTGVVAISTPILCRDGLGVFSGFVSHTTSY